MNWPSASDLTSSSCSVGNPVQPAPAVCRKCARPWGGVRVSAGGATRSLVEGLIQMLWLLGRRQDFSEAVTAGGVLSWLSEVAVCRSCLAEKRRLGKGRPAVAEGINRAVPVGDRRVEKLAQRLCAGRRRDRDQKGEVSEVAQSCPTLCDPMDCSLPGSLVHGILQARILKWVSISFSRGSSRPSDRTQVSCIVGRCFTI